MENFNKKAKVNDFAAYRGLLLTVSMLLAPFCFHIPTASGFHAAQYSYMSGKLIGPMLSFVCEDAVFQMRKCCFIVNTIIIFTIQRLFAENLRSCGAISRPSSSFCIASAGVSPLLIVWFFMVFIDSICNKISVKKQLFVEPNEWLTTVNDGRSVPLFPCRREP